MLYDEARMALTKERLEDLRTIPTVMSIAIGAAKTPAILGALRTGVIDVFCTDLDTATAVLELNNRTADYAEILSAKSA